MRTNSIRSDGTHELLGKVILGCLTVFVLLSGGLLTEHDRIREVRVAREPDGTLRISTPGPHWAMALFAAAYLGLAAVFLVAELVSGPQLSNVGLVLVLLLFGGFLFFRLLAGETITVDDSRVTLRSAVGPLGRTRRIPIHEIERLLAATKTDGETQSRITIFRKSGRPYGCGWVSEYEAAEIVKLIETRLQQLR